MLEMGGEGDSGGLGGDFLSVLLHFHGIRAGFRILIWLASHLSESRLYWQIMLRLLLRKFDVSEHGAVVELSKTNVMHYRDFNVECRQHFP